MIDLRSAKKIVVLGGGTAGWFTAITLRKIFHKQVDVRVIESSKIGIVGVGEGGLLNLEGALRRNRIDIQEFMRETDATYKWGFSYEGWRTGAADDKFHHLFLSDRGSAGQWYEYGTFPYFAAMINHSVPLETHLNGFDLVRNQATQAEAAAFITHESNDMITSYHFDSYKVATYLKKVALSRGVTHQDTIVDRIELDEKGFARRLITEANEVIECDFLVDASGLSRKVLGNTLNGKWSSFKDYLLMDRAVPFHMPHPFKNPMLVTRAIAMKAGWMWQIPLRERVGAGYVYSSAHLSEDEAIAEVEQYLGYPVETQKLLKFDPGCFEEVWVNNIVGVGLASGFVEPLEATSIGQMLEQVRNLERVLMESHGLVTDTVVNDFNKANLSFWFGIRDFLRMHYDCSRRDTPLWQAVGESKMPDTYAALKACMQERLPHMVDLGHYSLYGWGEVFHVTNWMSVAAPLGVIPVRAAANELLGMPQEKQAKAVQFALDHKRKLQLHQ